MPVEEGSVTLSETSSVRHVSTEPVFYSCLESPIMDRLGSVLEASPDAVLVVDKDGVIQQANRNVAEVLGYSPSELEGELVEVLLPEADREHHVSHRQEYMTNPEPRPMGSDLDLYALHKDGTNVPVEISLGPIERAGELYVVATITDISERKRRERALQRQNERLEEFASIVSHDLRGPLSVAAGRLELAHQECDSEHLDAIEQSHNRMEALIEDLLTLAREGKMIEDVEKIELSPFVHRCWQTIDTTNATLCIETDCSIRADETRLRQLLDNLLRNAIEHGGEDVTVTVGELQNGFFVADDGPGIPPGHREQVFKHGYSTSDDGTGFGLPIVKEVANAHDWHIRITESASGGARFEITGVEVART